MFIYLFILKSAMLFQHMTTIAALSGDEILFFPKKKVLSFRCLVAATGGVMENERLLRERKQKTIIKVLEKIST